MLVNHAGERFMVDNHPRAELAPRDIVARGIVKEMKSGGTQHVFLDITSKSEEYLRERFPTIWNECLKHGINIAHDKIPVHPVQHYLMGGIKTDLNGRTNIKGLYACGEAASTGIHGANRLAANSLLECLVFGRRTAQSINESKADMRSVNTLSPQTLPANVPVKPHNQLDYEALRSSVQQIMDDCCGVIRKKTDLKPAAHQVENIYKQLDAIFDESIDYIETLNIATVAKEILEAAYQRSDSIGSHYIIEED